MSKIPDMKKDENKIGDFYWAYADILRGIGINETVYDQRILAFMSLKLLLDNQFLTFNFDHKNDFNILHETLDPAVKNKFSKLSTTKEKFTFLIKNIISFSKKEFNQSKRLNPDEEHENILYYLNHKRTFDFTKYIDELNNEQLELVLNIYSTKANFVNFPQSEYKNLYEKTIARMKKLSGELTGQHFTQASIIHLMNELVSVDALKNNESINIYDCACGTGSMLMESINYLKQKKGFKKKMMTAFGQEIHGQTWFLAKVFLTISGINNFIAYGNTLTDPKFTSLISDNENPPIFDFIIANPPFGMDWKHDKKTILDNMLQENSNFYTILNEKGNPVTPKQSDGQFLFFQHIMKIMEYSKKLGRDSKAIIISSTGLLSSTSKSDIVIKKDMFGKNWVETIIEQPKSMFVNTDIRTHLWILSTKNVALNNWPETQNKVRLIQLDNDFVNKNITDNKNKVKTLFSDAEKQVDKQKNGYSAKNIKSIKVIYNEMLKNEKKKPFLFGFFKGVDKEQVSFSFSDLESEEEFDILSLIDCDNTQKIEDIFHPGKLYKGFEFYSLIPHLFNEDKVTHTKQYINKSIYTQDEYMQSLLSIYEPLTNGTLEGYKKYIEHYLALNKKHNKMIFDDMKESFEHIYEIVDNFQLEAKKC